MPTGMRVQMRKQITVAALVVVLAAGGIYGYKQHERSEAIASVAPSIKNASIRVLNTSKLDTEKTSITFKELFDRLEADTSEMEKRSIDIQSAANKSNASITDPAIAYIKECQEFSRALGMKYRKGLAFSSAMDRVREILAEPTPTSSYEYEYRNNRRSKALDEMNKTSEETGAAEKDLVAAAKRLKEARAKAATIFSEDTLVANSQLDAVIKANTRDESKGKSNEKATPKG
jgi:hypothetical protein